MVKSGHKFGQQCGQKLWHTTVREAYGDISNALEYMGDPQRYMEEWLTEGKKSI